MSAVDLLLAAAAFPVLVMAAYLALLTLLARRSVPPEQPNVLPRFEIVVPAHDEEAGVGATVRSLLALDYPKELFSVTVVADNCSDRTAEVATTAGARVLGREDPSRRGKGYALAFAFERIVAAATADAVVVVDADTVVSANLLRAMASRLARGDRAVQAEYGVRNAEASWRTRLLRIALAVFHKVRSLARERLAVSVGLRGNGMAFSLGLLRDVPHDAYSIVEDLEYGVRLGLAGHRVAYAAEAEVLGEMAASEEASRSQRRRWEGGRWTMARRHAATLVVRGLRERSLLLLDLALDLLVPPLTWICLATAVGLGATAAAWAFLGPQPLALVAWGLVALGVSLYVGRGVALSGAGPRGILDLLWAPVYVAWKLLLFVRHPGHRKGEWVRTRREGEA